MSVDPEQYLLDRRRHLFEQSRASARFARNVLPQTAHGRRVRAGFDFGDVSSDGVVSDAEHSLDCSSAHAHNPISLMRLWCSGASPVMLMPLMSPLTFHLIGLKKDSVQRFRHFFLFFVAS